ncbi:DUF2946 family protein [Novosphingobium sp. JCM 18896]|uniref:DUF2946 family protein n=1 Tax=Novosphingobium sp. JCM 18896 TaxID=2989731 RepID=UPI0022218CB1|nr:DUF2946 family protein [Novosphingobium sp. JCM 18896]MCW1429918.1 hypothetical protein [Novosphingobium sp. JCM 18896]
MHALRALVHRHRLLAAMIVVCALAMKIAVPAGYMLGQHGKVLTVEICADASGSTVTKQIVVPASHGDKETQAKASETCPYAALGFPALNGADPLLLALALAFILALGFVPAQALPLQRRRFARPPLRGPPALV